MPSWQGRSRGSKTGFRIFVWVLRTGGVRPAYFLLGFVSFYYFLFSRESSRHLYAYFHQRLGYPALKSVLNIYKNYYWFGQTIIDRVVLMSGIPHQFSFDFDGEHYLREMVAEKKRGLTAERPYRELGNCRPSPAETQYEHEHCNVRR